jgi:Histidinol dehydrogenase
VQVIADSSANASYVASDLLSQAEHGPDSQVVLLAVDLSSDLVSAIEDQIHRQAMELPRVDIVRECISKSHIVKCRTLDEALELSNDYAPEHLILHLRDARQALAKVRNAGSVFVGEFSPERSVPMVGAAPGLPNRLTLLVSENWYLVRIVVPAAATTRLERTTLCRHTRMQDNIREYRRLRFSSTSHRKS